LRIQNFNELPDERFEGDFDINYSFIMKIYKVSVFVIMSVLMLSCKKDDDGGIVIRDLGEVAIEDDAEIVEYLETHFYNYEAFETPPEGFDYKIVIDTIAGANASKTPLMDQVTTRTITVADVDHKLYYLIARQGVGENPHTSDRATLIYRGSLLSGDRFDVANVPVSFDLVGDGVTSFGVVRGFREFVKELKIGSGSVSNPDGTVTYNNDYGIGAVFMPSGLGYFANAQSSIPAYSPLVFTMAVFEFEPIDHDGDGILSYLEDLDGDANPNNDNTDEDNRPNYLDTDDDGDGVLTRFEITINEDGSITYTDCDGDGIPDYLDSDLCNN